MPNNSADKTKPVITKDQRILAKNSMFSFINTYFNYFTSLATSFLMARLISQDDWGLLILALSYVGIASLLLGFLPPGLGYSYNYYVPRYLALNQNNKIKSFIKNSLYIRLFCAIIFFFISFLIFFLFSGIFSNLEGKTHLLLLLSPLIIIYSMEKEFLDINRSFNMFNLVFIIILIKNSINLGALLFCFLFITGINIETIALINLFTVLIPFLVNVLIIFIFFQRKLKKTDDEKLSLREIVKNLLFYGGQSSFQSFLISAYKNFQLQSVGTFAGADIVTGFNIANHYREVSTGSVGSINKPLIISFSSLFSNKEYSEIAKTYNVILHYTLFILLIFTGILYFLGPLFLFLIYGESYLNYTIILRLVLITVIFGVQGRFFDSVLKASDKIKYLIPFSLIMIIIRVILFLLGLLYFGIIGALIGMMCASLLRFTITTILNFKLFKIKMNFMKTLSQYLIFFVALYFSLILGTLFLNDLNYSILVNLNLLIFKNFEFLSLLVFLLIYFVLIIIFKIITVSDIEIVEMIFKKDKRFHKIIRKGLNFLKKFVRH